MYSLINTVEFEMVIGTVKGYEPGKEQNELDVLPIKEVIDIYDKIATKTYEETGIYVSVVIQPCVTVYKQDWGCPKGGEPCYKISAVMNRIFNDDYKRFSEAVYANFLELKKELGQVSVTIVERQVGAEYINSKFKKEEEREEAIYFV